MFSLIYVLKDLYLMFCYLKLLKEVKELSKTIIKVKNAAIKKMIKNRKKLKCSLHKTTQFEVKKSPYRHSCKICFFRQIYFFKSDLYQSLLLSILYYSKDHCMKNLNLKLSAANIKS